MANRLPGTGPVYEPNWIVKSGVVAANQSVKRGDIVTTTPAGVQSAANDAALGITGCGQALEDAGAGEPVQIALSGSIIRALCDGVVSSGQKVKIKVTGTGKQTLTKIVAADIPTGKGFATFLHVESSPLTTPAESDTIGVFQLG